MHARLLRPGAKYATIPNVTQSVKPAIHEISALLARRRLRKGIPLPLSTCTRPGRQIGMFSSKPQARTRYWLKARFSLAPHLDTCTTRRGMFDRDVTVMRHRHVPPPRTCLMSWHGQFPSRSHVARLTVAVPGPVCLCSGALQGACRMSKLSKSLVHLESRSSLQMTFGGRVVYNLRLSPGLLT